MRYESRRALRAVTTQATFRAPVLVYLMLGGALGIRDDGDDSDAWARTSIALDKVWDGMLTDYERLALNYETRIAIAEAEGTPTC